MARTTATAKKSTGGNAPRRELGRKGNGVTKLAPARTSIHQEDEIVASQQACGEPVSKIESDDQSETYCYVCGDGNKQLILCDSCTRVVCHKHLGGLPSAFDVSQHKFLCMVCHIELLGNIPYRAFYDQASDPQDPHSWAPVLPQPIILTAAYSLSKKCHVSNKSTLILHFCLKGLQNKSLPPYVVELAVREYLAPPSFHLIEQVYDFTDGIDAHAANVDSWVKLVRSYERIVVFITTHAHDTTGDLYGGPEFSSLPYEVLKALFPSPLRQALQGKQVYLNFLVCGGFTDTPSSRMALFKVARKVHATEAIAFSSPGLIPTLTNTFWLDFAQRVLVEGFSLQSALPYMLAATSTSSFVRHTNLLYVRIPRSSVKPVTCSELVWTHPEFRPFGRRLPANCTECGCIDSLGRPIKLTPKSGTKYIFVCQGRNIAGNTCLHELVVEPMEGFEPYRQPQNGARWMVRTEATVI